MTYFDFNLVEDLAVVHTDDAADHFWHNDHVTQVSLDALKSPINNNFNVMKISRNESRTKLSYPNGCSIIIYMFY